MDHLQPKQAFETLQGNPVVLITLLLNQNSAIGIAQLSDGLDECIEYDL